MSETPKQKKLDVPTSPDSFKFNPPNITPGTTLGPPYFAILKMPQLQPEPSPPDQMIQRTVLKTEKPEGA
jgi:hypothetical protein